MAGGKSRPRLPEVVKQKRIEIAILISGLSFIGILWVWILALLWMRYRRLEEDFVKLWPTFPEFIPEEQFRSIFNEETYPIFTQEAFLYTLKWRNFIKLFVVGALCIPLYGSFFIFLFPIFVPIMFLILASFMIIGFGSDIFNSLVLIEFILGFILVAIIFTVIVFRLGIRSPFTEELKRQKRPRNPLGR